MSREAPGYDHEFVTMDIDTVASGREIPAGTRHCFHCSIFESEVRTGPVCEDCGRPATWAVRVMGGQAAFCDRDAKWYLDQGPDIYPSERIPT